jgi:phage host-nuclease inhibitor protein Gam
MTKKVKSTGLNMPVPQNDDEARSAITEIGNLNRYVLRIEADMNDRIATIREEYGAKAAPMKAEVKVLQEGLKTFCEAHRARLTKDGKVKFHTFTSGRVSWRVRPPKVTIRGLDRAIESIRESGFADRFLRTKHEVNKDAMLDSPDEARTIPGVSVGSAGEDFIVEPFETDLAKAS